MKKSVRTGNPITEGVIWKQILFFFFPILLGSFFQQFYNTIDMIVVGRFVGKVALASVGGSSGQIVNLVVGFFTGLSAGAAVIIAQHYGAGNETMLNDGIHTAYALSIVGGILFGILGILLSPTILGWMNTPKELIASSSVYLRIYFAGLIFVFIYNVGSGILRALGDSRTPLYILIICCLVNIALDLLFVVGFQMGVSGVAVATLIAQAVSSVLVTWVLMCSKDIYRLELRKIRFHFGLLKSQLYLGVPGGVQSVMYSLSNIIIQTAVNGYGTNAAAAWASQSKLDAIFWMMSGAYGASITTFAGQNYGAGKYSRIRKGVKDCILMYQGTAVLLAGFLLIFRYPLFRIFTTDEAVVQIGAEIMMAIAPYFIIFSFVEILSSALRSMSIVIAPLFMTMFGVCLLRVVWIFFIVPLNPSLKMIVSNYPVTWIVTSIMFICYYQYKKKSLYHETV